MGDITHLLVMLYFVISFFDSRFQCQPLVHFHTHTLLPFSRGYWIWFRLSQFQVQMQKKPCFALDCIFLNFFQSIFDLCNPKFISFLPSENLSLFIQNFRTIVLSIIWGWNIWIWMKKKYHNNCRRIPLNGYCKYSSRSPTLSEVSVLFSI